MKIVKLCFISCYTLLLLIICVSDSVHLPIVNFLKVLATFQILMYVKCFSWCQYFLHLKFKMLHSSWTLGTRNGKQKTWFDTFWRIYLKHVKMNVEWIFLLFATLNNISSCQFQNQYFMNIQSWLLVPKFPLHIPITLFVLYSSS